jgi:hypothetical protein
MLSWNYVPRLATPVALELLLILSQPLECRNYKPVVTMPITIRIYRSEPLAPGLISLFLIYIFLFHI